jgi:hypothetical protein
MDPRVARRIDQLPIPPSSVESARLLVRIGASLIGDTCVVMLADGAMLVPVALFDRDETVAERAMPLLEPAPLDRFPVVKGVLASDEPAFGPLVLEDVRTCGSQVAAAIVEMFGVHSYLIVPLKPSLGVVAFFRHSRERSRFYREHVELATELADTMAPQLETSEHRGGLATILRS